LEITRKSMLSGTVRTREIDVSPEVLEKWERGEGLIQTLMPNLTPDDREFIMTGVTKEEWDKLHFED
jgi:hypothetical protein